MPPHPMPVRPHPARLAVEELEARTVPAVGGLPNFAAVGAASQPVLLAVATATGGGTVRVFDFQTQTERFDLTPFGPGYSGGVRVATGDVNGDGTPDVLCASGSGRVTTVKVYDGATGAKIASFAPLGNKDTSGVSVAAADFDGDGKADVVVGSNSRPVVKVVGGASVLAATPVALGRFTAFGSGFSAGYSGGVRVAAGDVDGDGTPDVVAVTAAGRAIVAGFSGTTIGQAAPFQPFAPYFATAAGAKGGGWVAASDVNFDGFADIAAGNGSGAARARIVDGKTLPAGGNPTLIRSVALAGGTAATGVRVGLLDLNTDGRAELVEAANVGGQPVVDIYDGLTGSLLTSFDAFPTTFLGGVDVG